MGRAREKILSVIPKAYVPMKHTEESTSGVPRRAWSHYELTLMVQKGKEVDMLYVQSCPPAVAEMVSKRKYRKLEWMKHLELPEAENDQDVPRSMLDQENIETIDQNMPDNAWWNRQFERERTANMCQIGMAYAQLRVATKMLKEEGIEKCHQTVLDKKM